MIVIILRVNHREIFSEMIRVALHVLASTRSCGVREKESTLPERKWVQLRKEGGPDVIRCEFSAGLSILFENDQICQGGVCVKVSPEVVPELRTRILQQHFNHRARIVPTHKRNGLYPELSQIFASMSGCAKSSLTTSECPKREDT